MWHYVFINFGYMDIIHGLAGNIEPNTAKKKMDRMVLVNNVALPHMLLSRKPVIRPLYA